MHVTCAMAWTLDVTFAGPSIPPVCNDSPNRELSYLHIVRSVSPQIPATILILGIASRIHPCVFLPIGLHPSQSVAVSYTDAARNIDDHDYTAAPPTTLAQRGKGTHASIFNFNSLRYLNVSRSAELGSSLSVNSVSCFSSTVINEPLQRDEKRG
ncbi:uncharacterized protein BJ212DRAFT_114347 [Suillus subaureus]|uniref:Uncharacterized protein n=1 Tax=Suillus subaureus TaxID=48587 RepID=A0A9P7ECM8_9AGAM|nr:uncharacterized protein BJ212DRAFT_114347 [Suillus subaureus]KAG1817920.1 hypothetical protein BJ212DRAFT_114347 [Suillus subaureus]